MIIQKTKKLDYDITLIHEDRPKTSLWKCQCKIDKDMINSKKLITYNLNNDVLNTITKMSCNEDKEPYYKIGNFIEVNSKNFVKLLKQFSMPEI